VLTVAAGLQALSPASELRLHLALYHTGRLLQDLFSFTNHTIWTLLPDLRHGLNVCRPQSETLLELGQINVAEHFAHEALEYEGDRPDLLRLLGHINVLKDRPKAARVFLSSLHQVPFHRQWAASRLRDLESDPGLSGDRELAQARSRMVSTDQVHIDLPSELLLRQLLEANRTNKMAFDYLMAEYLLTRQLDKIAEAAGRFSQFGYSGIPLHCEEAILLYSQTKEGTQVDLQGLSIRPETLRRFQQFREAARNENAEGRRALARDFGDTFWFHYLSEPAATGQTSIQPVEQ
jgi:hypothetical protein